MASLRVGMIGAGAIAGSHCKGILKHPEARVVCVADASRERAEALQKAHGITRRYDRWQDVVRDRDVDAVSIALPNALHAPVARAALQAGKHVMLDKPFAFTLKEALGVAAAARKSKRVLMIGMNQRFETASQTIREIVRRGDLGEIYHARAYWWRRNGIPRFGTWFCRKDLAGGGCMLDIGVHMLDLCLHLADLWEPESVSGAVYTKFGNRGLGEGGWGRSDRGKHVFTVEDLAVALIKFRGGATVELGVSWACHQETKSRNNVELLGTEGGASVLPPRIFRAAKKAGEYEVVEPQGVAIPFPHAERFVNWVNTILGREKPLCTVEQALTVQAILDAVYASAKTGREARVAARRTR
ncbi:MAG: Gfo/Idh/MocA family oxidoreductase [Planctomycetota bacterium]